MNIDPKLIQKLLITIFIIAGLFVGYQLISPTDEAEDAGAGTEQTKGYVEEDVQNFEASLGIDAQSGQKIIFDTSFEHTKPGEYSEIIVNAAGFEPGEFTIVYVRFAGTEDYIEAGGQEHTADSEGNISTRFTITQFGEYEVFLTSGDETYTSPVITVE